MDLISCSSHQTTKQPILFPPIFSTNFSQLSSWKTFHWSKTEKKTLLVQIKSLFSFSTEKTEKNSWKKIGKTRLVVWWFDVTNNILETHTFIGTYSFLSTSFANSLKVKIKIGRSLDNTTFASTRVFDNTTKIQNGF